jgi:hypothetical protein
MRLVQRTSRVHRIPLPTSVTIASRPSSRERDGDRYAGDLGFLKIRKFLPKGLDTPFSDLPVEAGQEYRLDGWSVCGSIDFERCRKMCPESCQNELNAV